MSVKYFVSFFLEDGHLLAVFLMVNGVDYVLDLIENKFLDSYSTVGHYFLHLFTA